MILTTTFYCFSLCVLFWFDAVDGQHLPACYNSWDVFLILMMVFAFSMCSSVFCFQQKTDTGYQGLAQKLTNQSS